ncbi:MAG TPA: hypothetical protein VL328_11240 [Gemmatimonadaceae bacterium]|jgi:hypothetical protein|nr:hypothetical protein [Gemmatimonadaceae bacterium]
MPPFNNAASAPSVHAGAVRRSSGRAALAVLAALAGFVLVLALLGGARRVEARGAAPRAGDDPEMLHMLMTPKRAVAAGDSARAAAVAATLRASIEKYRDTAAAVADGFRMFAPQVKTQKVYHFTRGLNAVREAFRFDPAEPTSLLYVKDADGTFRLTGAMYTAPKRFGLEQLDARVPLSIARWHKHVNWCVPKMGDGKRWLELKDGHPVFGPRSPIATKEACDGVGGRFLASPLGWMVHANVMTSDDPAVIWGDDHAHGGEHESGTMMDMDHSRM